MTTVKDFLGWLERDLSRFGATKDHLEVAESDHGFVAPTVSFKVRIYTDTNVYSIRARAPQPVTAAADPDLGYLGCTASSRKPRAGEDWTRGNDLHDGPLTEETWRRILADIVSYEMVRVHKTETPTVHELKE